MASSNQGNNKVTSVAIGLILLGLVLLFMNKTGVLAEIKQALTVISGGSKP